ncbi:hypothetical protein ENSA5_06190 [Enhygromyxa salina]|uniref:Uncharacterized protein n=1 Tax=Enhygromyxa salina TaxID=215803 RepID=A0A2S9YHL9_9BACT|nr:hypothetical protein ENSA5_06190 [Enhygromyxa salina]
MDGDGAAEIVLQTSHVALDDDYELTEPSDDYRSYYAESYAQRRITVLRPNLTRQLDAIIHQEMRPSILGMYADREIAGEQVELTPQGVTATWCDIEMNSNYIVQDCLAEVCSSPTSRVHLPYDLATDSYEEAAVEKLRPEIDSCDPP